ncbi:DNA ligase D [Flavobacterium sinopsychrotolerans]|uniref:DNA ligase (ATP) n=1 Tax=Flavobacterium sinopsychrotolerans TaxID=604089 RepID=A0A1H8LW24_9FLAO|nr:DNA ligase D [Flavobacterium sinopsychrotolerans]SEO09317.1 bifunctional non-homologous end joining protein LigD [Flavobacterium sinopsychrotolerans]
MALTKYIEKRNFDESPEPRGGNPDSDKLRFVIQKHDASHLHYDFRLEMEGVLKSWAVPKGPSTDPEVKRLAMMVEDHPYDYRNFEGIIPNGYGAGTVIVWDEGFYEIADANGKDKDTQDKELRKGIHTGKLHIALDGKKLKGEFALVKTQGRGENAWLLFKVKDKYVSTEDITLKDKSVISKKTLAQVEKTSTNFYGAKRVKESSVKSKKENSLNKRSDVRAASEKNKKDKVKKNILDTIIAAGKRSKFPFNLSPMFATMVDKPFDKEGWQYEIKWDGYRALAFCSKDQVELKSRNDKSFDKKFYSIHKALEEWNINAVVDGEVVVLDEDSKPNYGALQNWRSEADGVLYFYVFDLLWINGKNLMQLPLSERRNILKQIIPENDNIRFSENFDVSGIEFFETAKKMGLEGIIAKKSDSVYSAGSRSKDWLKIKANKRQEMVIGGYSKNEDSSKSFSSLLLGVYENGELIYTGKAGTGFNDKQQIEMLKQFKPYIIKTPPFKELPDINKPSRFQRNPPQATAIWMKPELVCEVSFTEMTTDGIMRHPSFQAMRIDKKAKDVIREEAVDTNEIIMEEKAELKKIVKPVGSKGRKTFLNPTDETQLREINGHEIKFTNLNKIYWPDEKITKRDLLNYYYQVAPYILPYLKDRPQSMNRHPDGITGESFYFKDVTGTAPDWIETFEYKSEADERLRNYLIAKDDASLLYMANLGCIEMNPWHSKVKTEDYPDWCIIDLDPAENTFQQVIEAANVTKDILESMGVTAYPKTSGSTGIHIYIPFGAKYTYDQSKEFARIIATLVQREIPKYTSTERIVKARKGKMYIDFLQNRPQATVAAPYSLRPKPGATVSMPLHWDEVKKGLKMSDFTIYNALERIKSAGDIFKPVLGKGINLEKVIKTYTKE